MPFCEDEATDGKLCKKHWEIHMRALDHKNMEFIQIGNEKDEEISSLRAENEALKNEIKLWTEICGTHENCKKEEWRPIEEAPKDAKFLVVNQHGVMTIAGYINKKFFYADSMPNGSIYKLFRPLPQPPEV